MTRISFEDRLEKADNPALKKLFRIILEKKTTLCVAADLESFEQIVKLIERIGDHICILKIHSELFGGNLEKHLEKLYELKKKYNFLLFEDRKFLDGDKTIEGCYRRMYARYVDLVTVFPNGGDAIFKAIESGFKAIQDLPPDEPRGCFAVCEVSFSGFIQPDSSKLLEVAARNSPICVGIIAQRINVPDQYSMVKATPGVHLDRTAQGNQQWRNPDKVMADGADIIIVGRGIVAADESEWEQLAKQYKEESFSAYLKQVGLAG